MPSSAALPSSFLLPTAAKPSLLLSCPNFSSSPSFFLRSTNPRFLRLSASLSDNVSGFSWLSPPHSPDDDDTCRGWTVVEPPPRNDRKKGSSAVLVFGVTCVGAFAAAIAYFSLSRNGLKLQFRNPLSSFNGGASSNISEAVKLESKDSNSGVPDESASISETSLDSIPEPEETSSSVSTRKFEQVRISVLVDSSQYEALSVLKKLKIIEDEVRADELCTRREYTRWLVRLQSSLERNPKHRIAPSQSLSGSVVAAFDDVGVEDPDFESIQALAEAGFIPSKLSGTSCYSDSSKGDQSFCFYPDRFISRQDLINWKAQLEYQFEPGVIEQMSKTKVDYMDVKDISSDASPELVADMLAGDKSIIRKVFGKSRRFQPKKPVTKSQAAVALTSGRTSEVVQNELSRLEAENSSRQTALKEIRCELLEKGDIERFWKHKLDEEITRGDEIQEFLIATLRDLEQEKVVRENFLADVLKEKAAMDCQRQLLQTLKGEVDEMSEKLASERAAYVSEQCNVQEFLIESQAKQEEILDKKSVLEAEIEAIKILRSWIEDEARKSQARAKVLEEVGRRWNWDDQP